MGVKEEIMKINCVLKPDPATEALVYPLTFTSHIFPREETTGNFGEITHQCDELTRWRGGVWADDGSSHSPAD